jgi:hypothetical protein
MFYDRSFRSVLGAFIAYQGDDHRINHDYIDSISQCLSHDSTAAYEQIKLIIIKLFTTHPNLQNQIQIVHIWCDSGSHFKSFETLGSMLYSLETLIQKKINVHYFVEGHGKSPVDAHFSLLSRWLEQLKTQKHISTTDELINALEEQAFAHHRNDKVNVSFIKYEPVCVDPTHNHYINPAPEDAMAVDQSNHVDMHREEGRVHCVRPSQAQYSLKLPPNHLNQFYHY